MTHVSPNGHEKAEWSRLAQNAYSINRNDLGHKFSAAASIPSGWMMPVDRFDYLQSIYRHWLVTGQFN